jgi:LPXTG-motif cell wall-anchored protein
MSAPRTPATMPSPAPIAPPADTGLSASTILLGALAVGGVAGAAYYFTKKGRR